MGMLFPKSKIQKTEYEDARKKRDRDHMGQIVLLVVKKLKRLCYITYARSPRPTTYRSLAAATILHAPVQIKRDQCICMQRNASRASDAPRPACSRYVYGAACALFSRARGTAATLSHPLCKLLLCRNRIRRPARRLEIRSNPNLTQCNKVVDACASFHKSLEEGACFQGFNNSWLYAFIVLLSVLNNGIKKSVLNNDHRTICKL